MLDRSMNNVKVTTTELRRDFRTVLDHLIRGAHVEVSNYTTACAVVVTPEWYKLASAVMDSALGLDQHVRSNAE